MATNPPETTDVDEQARKVLALCKQFEKKPARSKASPELVEQCVLYGPVIAREYLILRTQLKGQ